LQFLLQLHSVHGLSTDSDLTQPLFVISTSTPTATTTVFQIDASGKLIASNINNVRVVDGLNFAQTCAGINAAIDDLPSTGGEVFLPSATYTCAETVNIDVSNTTLRGAGNASVIDASAAVLARVIDLNGTDNGTYKDFKVLGNNGGGGSPGDAIGTSVQNPQNNLFENLYIDNSDGIGIFLDRSLTNKIVNSMITDSDGEGIKMNENSSSTSYGNTVTGNTVTGNGSYGIYMNGAGGEIANNIVQSNGANGIFIQSSANLLTITGNVVRLNTGDGIAVNHCLHCSVVGNTTEDNTSYGISVGRNPANNTTVIGNTLKDNDTGGIFVNRVDYVTISGNNLSDDGNATYGIRFYADGTSDMVGNSVTGNVIEGFTKAGADAIYIEGTSSFDLFGTLVADNIIRNNTSAIEIVSVFTKDTVISNNVFDSNTTDITDNGLGTTISVATSTSFGFGTTSPWGKLSVEQTASSSPVFVVSDQGTTSPHLIVSGQGFTGIGVSNPSIRLTVGTSTPGSIVSGNYYNSAYVSGDLEVDGTLFANTISGGSGFANMLAGFDSSGNLTSTSTPTAVAFLATSTTATSTFAGIVSIGSTTPNNSTLFQVGTSSPLLYADNNTGRIGIGTSNPQSYLHVVSSDASLSHIRLSRSTGSGKLVLDSTDGSGAISSVVSAYLTLFASANPAIIFDSTERLRIGSATEADAGGFSEKLSVDGGGNIGIGTTSPYTKLGVAGTVVADNFFATSTTATSTFAGFIDVTGTNSTSTFSGHIDIDGRFELNNEYFTDLTGTGLTNSGGALTVTGATLSGGANMIAGFDASGNLTSTSSPTAAVYFATSTTATSTFAGIFSIGSTTPDSSTLFQVGTSTSRLFVDANTGNVGIGTDSPAYPLDIFSPDQDLVRFTPNTSGHSATLTFQLDGDLVISGTRSTFLHGTNGLGLQSEDGKSININQDSKDVDIFLRWDDGVSLFSEGSSGNVGISTSSPYAKLSVHGLSTDSDLTQPLFVVATSTPSATTTAFVVTTAGNVGIGTDSPSQALDVNGNFQVTTNGDVTGRHFGMGNITANGSIANLLIRASGSTINPLQIQDSNNVVLFHVDDTASGGNIGIGTTSPYAKLTIWGEGTGTNTTFEVVDNASTTLFSILDNGNTTLTNATSTSLYTSTLGLNSEYFTDLTGTGLTNSGGVLTVTGATLTGAANMIAGFDASGNLTSTSSPTAAAYFATSTTATSTFAGILSIGSTTPNSSTLFQVGTSTSRLYVDSNTGRVGVGTDSPGALLEVAGTMVGSETFLRIEQSANANKDTLLNIRNTTAIGTGSQFILVEGPSDAQNFVVRGDGRVGIGTTSPASKLHIIGESNSPTLILSDGSGSPLDAFIGLKHVTFAEEPVMLIGGRTDGVDNFVNVGGHGTPSGVMNAATAILFYTAANDTTVDGTERMRIDSAGNIGIGTTSPYARLSVVGETVSEFFTATSTTATSTFAGIFSIGSTTPNSSTLFQVGTSTSLLYVDSNTGYVGIGTAAPNSSLELALGQIFVPNGTSNKPSYSFSLHGSVGMYVPGASDELAFSTDGDEVMRLDAGGRVGIGSSTPYAKLSINNVETHPSFIVEDSTSPDISPFIIDASGNVGIGTTSPYAKLSVVGETVSEFFSATSTTATSTFAGFLDVTGANSTSTFSAGLAALYIDQTGTNASSTFAGGINTNIARQMHWEGSSVEQIQDQ